jgi:hypothetical protein
MCLKINVKGRVYLADKKKKPLIKLNKKHGGKEFKSFFHYVGKVSPFYKREDGVAVKMPYVEQTETRTKKPRRVAQFTLETAKNNQLKVESAGMEQNGVYAYSRTEGNTAFVPWADRKDKSKLPNETYHIIEADWDKIEQYHKLLKDDAWVEVKGNFEFFSFINDEGQKITITKRFINSIEPVEDGQEIKVAGQKVNYVTDFDSEDFVEVNHFDLQIGINSVYQENEGSDTKINAYFLDYGKTKSEPYQIELKVPYFEPEEGNISLANAFTKLNRFDFVQVTGRDSNRAITSEVPVAEEKDDDPFSQVGSESKANETREAITGRERSLEVLAIVSGTWRKALLTEEDVKVEEPKKNFNPLAEENANDEDPFSNTGNSSNSSDSKDPFENDPFANSGEPIDISDDDLPF